jgi:hypothetical protein
MRPAEEIECGLAAEEDTYFSPRATVELHSQFTYFFKILEPLVTLCLTGLNQK